MKTHKHIKILLLEDMQSDAELIERTLVKSGFPCEVKWVDNKTDFIKTLPAFMPDVVLCDHKLPSITSVEALMIIKGCGLRIPFILITGTISEEFAVSMMKEGVDDYILKDRIQRLPKAIENALRKADAEEDRHRYFNEALNAGKRLQALIENISDAIMVISTQGLITYTSPSVKRVNGFDFDELNKKSFFDFLHPFDQTVIAGFISIASDQMPLMPSEHSFRMMHRSGGYIWVEGTISSFEHDERESSFIINYRDITRRRESALKLQESEANLRTVLDNTEVSYVLTDKKFNVISFNHIATRTYKKELHISLEEGGNLVKLAPGGMTEATFKNFELALSGQIVTYETSFNTSTGGNTWYQVKLLPVRDDNGQILGLLVSSEDITSWKMHEIERDKMTADILSHNKNLEQFSYIISHNLRAPVANIIGLASLLNNNIGLSKNDYDKGLHGLLQAANKLDDVIIDLNDILQKRHDVNEKKEMIDLPGLVSDIETSIGTMIEGNNIRIRTNFPVKGLFTIKSYLHSIFLNLITNSIKYRNPAVPTIIDISSKRNDSKVIISFKDNGLGIDMEAHKDKIFGLYKKFHQHKEGKGMGLYMVKTQVEMLGGTIAIKSEVNQGTEFTLEFES